jgi:hypothetical protein
MVAAWNLPAVELPLAGGKTVSSQLNERQAPGDVVLLIVAARLFMLITSAVRARGRVDELRSPCGAAAQRPHSDEHRRGAGINGKDGTAGRRCDGDDGAVVNDPEAGRGVAEVDLVDL